VVHAAARGAAAPRDRPAKHHVGQRLPASRGLVAAHAPADAGDLPRPARDRDRRDARRQRRARLRVRHREARAARGPHRAREARLPERGRLTAATREEIRMARLRYARTLDEVKRAHETNPEFLKSTVRSIRVVYETHPELVAAALPKPLAPSARPEVCVTFSHVAMHLSPQLTIEIGSAIFGVRARYEGGEGIYLLTMPMTTEQAVIGGRETYGEPKKIAKIDFAKDGERVRAQVERMGV